MPIDIPDIIKNQKNGSLFDITAVRRSLQEGSGADFLTTFLASVPSAFTAIPVGTEQTSGGTAAASHETSPNELAAEAFDNIYTTKWLATGSSTPWLRYQFTSARIIKKYAITNGNDFQDRDPRSWTFQGSDNAIDWTTLDTRTDMWFGPRHIRTLFFFNNSTAYLYYRLNITANWGSADTQLSELEMYL